MPPGGSDRAAVDALMPPRPPLTRAALLAIVCAALVLSTVAAYWGLTSNGFVLLDDDKYVTENPQVQQGLTGRSVLWAFTTTHATNWHPLTWLSHMLDVQLFGLNAGRHHLTSLLLHVMNALLLFMLLLWMTGALWRCAVVAALFALHPLHVESVAWIAERKDVLSTLLWLSTLGTWLGYVKSKKATFFALTLAAYALGLMAKPMLVTLPFSLLLLDYWPLDRLALPPKGGWERMKGLLWEKAPLFAMAAVSSVITVIAQQGAMQYLSALSFSDRAANALQSYGRYLGKTFWPSNLAVFYPLRDIDRFSWSTAASCLLVVGVTLLALRLSRKAPYLLFGWLWYLGTLVPVIGLVQVGAQSMADRYTYVPLVGVFVAVVWGTADFLKEGRARRLTAVAVSAGIVTGSFALTRIQVAYWADTETLFGHAAAVTSGNWMAHGYLGASLALSGSDKMEEAIAHYTEALKINPALPDVHNNLATALRETGRLEEAAVHYREALKLRPDGPVLLRSLGLTLLMMDRIPEAVDCLARAIRVAPSSPESHLYYGQALDRAGRLPEALEQFQLALNSEPRSAKILTLLGIGLQKMGRSQDAIARFEEAVRISPDYADAHINLGVVLDHAGRTAEAVEHFEEAVKLRPGAPQVLDNLGLALARMDRLPEAITRFQEAARAAPFSAPVRYHLGIALVRARRFPEASEQLREAVRLRPDDPQARSALRQVESILRIPQ